MVNNYIKTADFESQIKIFKSRIKALSSEDEKTILWMISMLEKKLVNDYQGIEIPECLRVEKR